MNSVCSTIYPMPVKYNVCRDKDYTPAQNSINSEIKFKISVAPDYIITLSIAHNNSITTNMVHLYQI